MEQLTINGNFQYLFVCLPEGTHLANRLAHRKKWIAGPHRGRFGDSSFSFFRRGECGWRGIHRKNEVQVTKPTVMALYQL